MLTSFDAQDYDDRTPLHLAAHNDHEEIVKILLKKPVNTNAKDRLGYTPLHVAAKKGYLEIAQCLLQKSSTNPNEKDEDGKTPLHWAARNGHTATVELLLTQPGIDFDAQDLNGQTALYDAVDIGHVYIVECLLKKLVNTNAKDKLGFAPLHVAAQKGYLEIAQCLLEKSSTNPNEKAIGDKTPLHYAIQKDDVGIVKILLQYGANPNLQDRKGRTPVDRALASNREILKMLLIHPGTKIKTHYQDQPLFHILLEKGSVETFEMLSSRHPQLVSVKLEGKNGFTLLDLAVRQVLSKMVHILLNYEDIDVNQGIPYSPLYVAASKGYVEIVNTLLRHSDIKFDLCGVAKTTPFEIANLRFKNCKTHDEKAKYEASMAALTAKAAAAYEKEKLLPSPYNRL